MISEIDRYGTRNRCALLNFTFGWIIGTLEQCRHHNFLSFGNLVLHGVAKRIAS